MTIVPGDTGSGAGGGTAEHVCAPNPADTLAIFDNLLSRIKALEDAVTQLAAANLLANQLSDLSQQVGWVDNVTYMGIPGWTQTEYGTLIPPTGMSLSTLGITMSDGNAYQAVTMDSDGVLQFGFMTNGQVVGALPDLWNAVSSQDYARVTYDTSSLSHTESRGCTITLQSISSTQVEIKIQVAQAGLYHVEAFDGMDLEKLVGPFAGGIIAFVTIVGGGETKTLRGHDAAAYPDTTAGVVSINIALGADFLLVAGDIIVFNSQTTGVVGSPTRTRGGSGLSVVRISG